MAKALFFPNYLGGGFGHTGRCLALAEAWESRGFQAAFAIGGVHAHRVAEAGYACYPLHFPRLGKPSQFSPAYVYLTGMNYQIVRDGFDHPLKVDITLWEARQIIEREHPDVLVGDGWPLTHLLGRQMGLPVVQLVKSVANPRPAKLTWWEADPEGLIPPDPGPVFDPARKRMGLPALGCAEELLDGDLMLIPGIPALDPMPNPPANMAYVGSITRRSAQKAPAWFDQLNANRPLVYITVGGAAGGAGSSEFYQLVRQAFEPTDFQVVVSTGGKALPANPASEPKIRWETWVPTAAILPRCAAIVFHGGYTRMEVVESGTPSVVIPFHSEQEYFGRQMADAGASILLPYSEAPYTRFEARWRGGKWLKVSPFSIHVRLKPTLQADALRAAVTNAVTNPMLRSQAQELKAELNAYGGCEQAVGLIQKLIR
jgi:UDP:flavonoid glycosyltransferase YjiC (YdhE family)